MLHVFAFLESSLNFQCFEKNEPHRPSISEVNVAKIVNKTKKKSPNLFLILLFEKTEKIWKNLALIQTYGLEIIVDKKILA